MVRDANNHFVDKIIHGDKTIHGDKIILGDKIIHGDKSVKKTFMTTFFTCEIIPKKDSSGKLDIWNITDHSRK